MKARKFLCIALIFAMLLSLSVLPVFAAAGDQGIELLGASMRITGEQGLRFVGRIAKSGSITLTEGENANFGILLIPQSALAANATITKDTPNVLQVPAKNLMGQAAVEAVGLTYDGDYTYFSAVQIGIPVEFYGTEWVARAYVIDGSSDYHYSEQMKRSIKGVAESIVADGSAPADQKTAANTVINDYNANDGAVPVPFERLAVLTAYPEYPAEIARDTLYSVNVTQGLKNQPLTVYNQAAGYSFFDKGNSSTRVLGASDSNRRFCEFAFSDMGVTVHIKVNKSFSTYSVSPSSKNFPTSYADGVISVTLNQPEYFVVMLDNDYNTALAVFADAPETNVPVKGTSNLVYVDTDGSITDPSNLITYAGGNNEVIKISKNYAKIYIAPGAVLKKRVVFTRADSGNTAYHCGISGRGMILDPYSDAAISDQNNVPSYTDWNGSSDSPQNLRSTVVFHGYGCTMEDVKVVNSANFNVAFKQDFCYANHVKLLSTEMSTDGFTCVAGSGEEETDGVVENCFVYVGDNALVIGNASDKTGYRFRNITIGTTCAAIYPQHNANTTLEDIYVFRADDGLINVYENNVGSQTVNITNLDALACVKTPWLFGAKGNPGTATKTFNLNNVVMRYNTGESGSFTPGASTNAKTLFINRDDSTTNTSGFVLNLTNLYVGGTRIDGAYDKARFGYSSSGANTADTTYSGYGFSATFVKDNDHLPACSAVPAAKTANYTYTGNAYTGVEHDWTRYQSYKCNLTKSGNAYTVTTTQSESATWGMSKDITDYIRANGTGSYTVTLGNISKGVTVYVVKCSASNGTTTSVVNGTSVSSGSNKTVNFAVDDAGAVWQIIIKSNATSGSFTVTNPVVSKK